MATATGTEDIGTSRRCTLDFRKAGLSLFRLLTVLHHRKFIPDAIILGPEIRHEATPFGPKAIKPHLEAIALDLEAIYFVFKALERPLVPYLKNDDFRGLRLV